MKMIRHPISVAAKDRCIEDLQKRAEQAEAALAKATAEKDRLAEGLRLAEAWLGQDERMVTWVFADSKRLPFAAWLKTRKEHRQEN